MCGTSKHKAESIFGIGVKHSFFTIRGTLTSKIACKITLVIPYSFVPNLEANRSATSFWISTNIDENFSKRAKENNSNIIVAKENYGQGSSREHAAIAPRYLNVKAVIASSFARIHKKNLINFGILPIELDIEAELYDDIKVEFDFNTIKVTNSTKNKVYTAPTNLSEEEYNLININKLKTKLSEVEYGTVW